MFSLKYKPKKKGKSNKNDFVNENIPDYVVKYLIKSWLIEHLSEVSFV